MKRCRDCGSHTGGTVCPQCWSTDLVDSELRPAHRHGLRYPADPEGCLRARSTTNAASSSAIMPAKRGRYERLRSQAEAGRME